MLAQMHKEGPSVALLDNVRSCPPTPCTHLHPCPCAQAVSATSAHPQSLMSTWPFHFRPHPCVHTVRKHTVCAPSAHPACRPLCLNCPDFVAHRVSLFVCFPVCLPLCRPHCLSPALSLTCARVIHFVPHFVTHFVQPFVSRTPACRPLCLLSFCLRQCALCFPRTVSPTLSVTLLQSLSPTLFPMDTNRGHSHVEFGILHAVGAQSWADSFAIERCDSHSFLTCKTCDNKVR